MPSARPAWGSEDEGGIGMQSEQHINIQQPISIQKFVVNEYKDNGKTLSKMRNTNLLLFAGLSGRPRMHSHNRCDDHKRQSARAEPKDDTSEMSEFTWNVPNFQNKPNSDTNI